MEDQILSTEAEVTEVDTPIETETEEAPDDGFWDDEDTDANTEAEADQPEAEDTADDSKGNPDAPDGAEEEPATEQEPPAPEMFELKHLGEVKEVSKEEAIALAQKGMDYDRVKEKLDEVREKVGEYESSHGYVKAIAEKMGTSVPEYLKAMRIQALTDAGIDETTAKARIELEDEKAQMAAEKAALEAERLAKEKEAEAVTATEKKRKDEIAAFIQRHPDIKPDTIPKEVWDTVAKGEALTAAYAEYENKQLKKELLALKQEHSNKAKTVGSVSSAGEKNQTDPFLEGWVD